MFRNRLICDWYDRMLGSSARFGCVFRRCGHSRRLLSKASGSDGGRKGVVMTESFADNGEHYHLTPMGEGDASQRTTMTALSAQMTERNETCVVGFSKFGFRMNDKSFLYGPIATFPKLTLSWRVLTPDDINEESVEFFTLLDPKLDIVVIGVGDRKNLDAVRKRLSPVFSRHRIGAEILPTEDAIPIFNYLNAEGRYVAAGLYPPDNFGVSKEMLRNILNWIEPFDTLKGDPVLFPVSAMLPKNIPNVISDMWHGKQSVESMSKEEREKRKVQDADREIIEKLKDK